MVQYSNRLKVCWYNLERGVVDPQQKKKNILENTHLSNVFLSVSGILLPGIFCENPDLLSVLSEPGNGYSRGSAQGPTHCRALPSLSSGEKLNSFFLLHCLPVFWLTYAYKGPVPAEKMDFEETLETSLLEEKLQQHWGHLRTVVS